MPLTTEELKHISVQLPTISELNLKNRELTRVDVEQLVAIIGDSPRLTGLNLTGNGLTDEDLEPLKKLSCIQRLSLAGNRLTDKSTDIIDHLKNLTVLDLNFNDISDAGCIALTKHPKLITLALNGNSITANGLSFFPYNSSLRTLYLMNNEINSEGSAILAKNKYLQSIFLGNNFLGDEGAKEIAKHCRVSELSLPYNHISLTGAVEVAQAFHGRLLNVSNNQIGDEGAKALIKSAYVLQLNVSHNQLSSESMVGIASNTTLLQLDLSYNQIDNTALTRISHNHCLTHLNLARNTLDQEGVASLSHNQSLLNLNLSYNHLDDSSAIALSENSSITSLGLCGNLIGSKGAVALSKIPKLKKLLLDYNLVGDEGAEALAANPTLSELFLGCNQITDVGALALSRNTTINHLCLNYNHISEKVRDDLIKKYDKRVLYIPLEPKAGFIRENLNYLILLTNIFFCSVDENGIIQFFNSYFCASLGYEIEDILGKPLMDYLHPHDHAMLKKVISKSITKDISLRFLCKDGDYCLINWCFYQVDHWIYLSGVDLSYQKKSEMVFKRLVLDELKRAKEYAEKQTEFIAHLCHEIRNPVSGIFSMTEVIGEHIQNMRRTVVELQKSADGQLANALMESMEAITNTIKDIKTCCRYEENILNDNIDVAKISERKLSLHMTPLNISQIINDVAAMTYAKAQEKGLGFQVNIMPSADYWVKGDVMRIKQIVLNLLNNAIKFTDKGYVNIRLHVLEQTASQLRVAITVKDSGLGLTKEEIDRLFKSYAQANLSIGSQYGGSGLGLFISKHLAILMGGDIHVESRANEGSVFTATFVCERLSAEQKVALVKPHASAPLSPPTPSTSYHILVVEDNDINIKSLVFILTRLGHRTTVARDGVAAVAAYKSQYQQFDLVLMDTHMPKMNGLEAIATIRAFEKSQHLPRKAIATLSGNVMEADKSSAFAAGADDYITKPFKKAELAETIERLARGAFHQAAQAGSTSSSSSRLGDTKIT